MKHARLTTLAVLLLSGCSYTQFLPMPATATVSPPSATATVSLTPTPTASVTPTQPTPTFTGTPTLFYPNGTPIPSDTPTATSTLYSVPTVTNTAIVVQAQGGDGPFTKISLSGNLLFWGRCEPNVVHVAVHVSDTIHPKGVVIELRLQDVKSGDTTDWGGGAIMDGNGKGDFTYNLTAQNFEHYHDYMKAWGQYQFVAYDENLAHLGASQQYLKSLVIAPCP